MLAADVTSPNATRSPLRTFWNVLMILPPPAVVWAINDGADLRLAADHGKNVVLSSFLLSHYFFFAEITRSRCRRRAVASHR